MSTFSTNNISHKTRRKIRKNRSRWRDVGEFILFLLALVSFLAIPASLDETIYYCEFEWMPRPLPYASDIRHYIALRYQGQLATDPTKQL